jgi:hypothetical protein
MELHNATGLRRSWQQYWRIGHGLALGVLVGACWTCTDAGRDIQASLFSGRQLITQTRVLDLGSVSTGTEARGRFAVRNVGLNSVRLLGVQADCACIVATDLPCTLAPFARHEIEIIVRAPEVADSQSIHHVLRVLPDCDAGNGPMVLVTMNVVPRRPGLRKTPPYRSPRTVCLGWSLLFRPFKASVPLRPSVSQGVALGCHVSAPSGRMFFVPRSGTAGSRDRPSYGNEVVHSGG